MSTSTASNPVNQDGIVLKGAVIPFEQLLNPGIVARAAEFRESFAHVRPYPFVVFDDLFSQALLKAIVSEFDDFGPDDWLELSNDREKTLRSRPKSRFGLATQLYFDTVSSPRFISFLTEVTGINGLLPDPLLRGGGMHESRPGGKFDLHLDFAKHPVTQLDNRLTLITYLNPDWKKEWGGVLELWDMDADRCAYEVLPLFGKTLLFAQTPKSLHGHPGGISTPNGRGRRSMTAYFYTNGRDDAAAAERFTTYFAPKAPPTPRQKVGQVVRAVTPPILYDAARLLWTRSRKRPA
jgi:hypothetical protein